MDDILRNAEGLPIESIDRIQVTLNIRLNHLINFEKRNIDPKKHLRLCYSNIFGMYWFMDIQAQKIDLHNIRYSIAEAVFELINEGFIELPISIPLTPSFIYLELDTFITRIRQIEFSFDFRKEDISITDITGLIYYKGTIYSNDYKYIQGKKKRRSFIRLYDRISRLKKVNQLSHKIIDNNPYSYRLEFMLDKNNSSLLALDNISGSYHDIITRYTPYLAIKYNKYFKNVQIDDVSEHPCFAKIYTLSKEGRERYTGNDLKKSTTHRPTEFEDKFYAIVYWLKYVPLFRTPFFRNLCSEIMRQSVY
jgi:hypothetical protein